GRGPAGRVVFGPDGALYGTTTEGGDLTHCQPIGCGTIFRLQPPPTTCKTSVCPWKKTTIHNFQGITVDFDGRLPLGDLALDNAGNMYGVTQNGGQYDAGAVYKLVKSGGQWITTTIHSFTILFQQPHSGVTIGPDGNLYGTVLYANHFVGGVYRLVP